MEKWIEFKSRAEEAKSKFAEMSEVLAQIDFRLFFPIVITDEEDLKVLPRVGCIYFLVHDEKGLLYIGKACDLKSRWTLKTDAHGIVREDLCHKCLFPLLELGDCCLHI